MLQGQGGATGVNAPHPLDGPKRSAWKQPIWLTKCELVKTKIGTHSVLVTTSISITVFSLSRWTPNIKCQNLLQLLGKNNNIINQFNLSWRGLVNSKHTKSKTVTLTVDVKKYSLQRKGIKRWLWQSQAQTKSRQMFSACTARLHSNYYFS